MGTGKTFTLAIPTPNLRCPVCRGQGSIWREHGFGKTPRITQEDCDRCMATGIPAIPWCEFHPGTWI